MNRCFQEPTSQSKGSISIAASQRQAALGAMSSKPSLNVTHFQEMMKLFLVSFVLVIPKRSKKTMMLKKVYAPFEFVAHYDNMITPPLDSPIDMYDKANVQYDQMLHPKDPTVSFSHRIATLSISDMMTLVNIVFLSFSSLTPREVAGDYDTVLLQLYHVSLQEISNKSAEDSGGVASDSTVLLKIKVMFLIECLYKVTTVQKNTGLNDRSKAAPQTPPRNASSQPYRNYKIVESILQLLLWCHWLHYKLDGDTYVTEEEKNGNIHDFPLYSVPEHYDMRKECTTVVSGISGLGAVGLHEYITVPPHKASKVYYRNIKEAAKDKLLKQELKLMLCHVSVLCLAILATHLELPSKELSGETLVHPIHVIEVGNLGGCECISRWLHVYLMSLLERCNTGDKAMEDEDAAADQQLMCSYACRCIVSLCSLEVHRQRFSQTKVCDSLLALLEIYGRELTTPELKSENSIARYSLLDYYWQAVHLLCVSDSTKMRRQFASSELLCSMILVTLNHMLFGGKKQKKSKKSQNSMLAISDNISGPSHIEVNSTYPALISDNTNTHEYNLAHSSMKVPSEQHVSQWSHEAVSYTECGDMDLYGGDPSDAYYMDPVSIQGPAEDVHTVHQFYGDTNTFKCILLLTYFLSFSAVSRKHWLCKAVLPSHLQHHESHQLAVNTQLSRTVMDSLQYIIFLTNTQDKASKDSAGSSDKEGIFHLLRAICILIRQLATPALPIVHSVPVTDESAADGLVNSSPLKSLQTFRSPPQSPQSPQGVYSSPYSSPQPLIGFPDSPSKANNDSFQLGNNMAVESAVDSFWDYIFSVEMVSLGVTEAIATLYTQTATRNSNDEQISLICNTLLAITTVYTQFHARKQQQLKNKQILSDCIVANSPDKYRVGGDDADGDASPAKEADVGTGTAKSVSAILYSMPNMIATVITSLSQFIANPKIIHQHLGILVDLTIFDKEPELSFHGINHRKKDIAEEGERVGGGYDKVAQERCLELRAEGIVEAVTRVVGYYNTRFLQYVMKLPHNHDQVPNTLPKSSPKHVGVPQHVMTLDDYRAAHELDASILVLCFRLLRSVCVVDEICRVLSGTQGLCRLAVDCISLSSYYIRRINRLTGGYRAHQDKKPTDEEWFRLSMGVADWRGPWTSSSVPSDWELTNRVVLLRTYNYVLLEAGALLQTLTVEACNQDLMKRVALELSPYYVNEMCDNAPIYEINSQRNRHFLAASDQMLKIDWIECVSNVIHCQVASLKQLSPVGGKEITLKAQREQLQQGPMLNSSYNHGFRDYVPKQELEILKVLLRLISHMTLKKLKPPLKSRKAKQHGVEQPGPADAAGVRLFPTEDVGGGGDEEMFHGNEDEAVDLQLYEYRDGTNFISDKLTVTLARQIEMTSCVCEVLFLCTDLYTSVATLSLDVLHQLLMSSSPASSLPALPTQIPVRRAGGKGLREGSSVISGDNSVPVTPTASRLADDSALSPITPSTPMMGTNILPFEPSPVKDNGTNHDQSSSSVVTFDTMSSSSTRKSGFGVSTLLGSVKGGMKRMFQRAKVHLKVEEVVGDELTKEGGAKDRSSVYRHTNVQVVGDVKKKVKKSWPETPLVDIPYMTTLGSAATVNINYEATKRPVTDAPTWRPTATPNPDTVPEDGLAAAPATVGDTVQVSGGMRSFFPTIKRHKLVIKEELPPTKKRKEVTLYSSLIVGVVNAPNTYWLKGLLQSLHFSRTSLLSLETLLLVVSSMYESTNTGGAEENKQFKVDYSNLLNQLEAYDVFSILLKLLDHSYMKLTVEPKGKESNHHAHAGRHDKDRKRVTRDNNLRFTLICNLLCHFSVDEGTRHRLRYLYHACDILQDMLEKQYPDPLEDDDPGHHHQQGQQKNAGSSPGGLFGLMSLTVSAVIGSSQPVEKSVDPEEEIRIEAKRMGSKAMQYFAWKGSVYSR